MPDQPVSTNPFDIPAGKEPTIAQLKAMLSAIVTVQEATIRVLEKKGVLTKDEISTESANMLKSFTEAFQKQAAQKAEKKESTNDEAVDPTPGDPNANNGENS